MRSKSGSVKGPKRQDAGEEGEAVAAAGCHRHGPQKGDPKQEEGGADPRPARRKSQARSAAPSERQRQPQTSEEAAEAE